MSYLFDPRLKMTLCHKGEILSSHFPALVAKSQHLAQTLIQGEHGRRKAGIGDPFWEYRLAAPSDDVSRIDWRKSARTESLYIREKEMQTSHALYMWCDHSPSMDFSSRPDVMTKLDCSLILTFALGSLLSRGGERVGLINEKQGGIRPSLVTGKRIMPHFLSVLSNPSTTCDVLPLSDLPKKSFFIWFTDGLFDKNQWNMILQFYASKNIRGLVVQILDTAEEKFPYMAHTCFVDPEHPEKLYDSPSPRRQQEKYQALFDSEMQDIHLIIEKAGWNWLGFKTNQDLLSVLGTLYSKISHRG